MVRSVGIEHGREEFGCGIPFRKLVFGKVILLLFLCPAASAALSGSEVLSRLQAFDEVFESGLTATGFTAGKEMEALGSGVILPAVDNNWTLVMARGRCALMMKSVEVPLSTYRQVACTPEQLEKHDSGTSTQVEEMVLWGPEFAGKFEHYRWYLRENDEVKVGGDRYLVHFIPPNDPAFDFNLKRFLWAMGRGFAKHIYEFNSVTELEDGTIKCCGIGNVWGSDGVRWELVVDPAAAYIVRSAKFYLRGAKKPDLEVTNSGTKSMNGCIVAESSVWSCLDPHFPKKPFTVRRVTREPDYKLLEMMEKAMFGPYTANTRVIDERLTPVWSHFFKTGQTYTGLDRLEFDPLKGLDTAKPDVEIEAGEGENTEVGEIKSKDTNTKAKSTTEQVTETGNANPVAGTSMSLGQLIAILTLCIALLAAVTYWRFRTRSRRT